MCGVAITIKSVENTCIYKYIYSTNPDPNLNQPAKCNVNWIKTASLTDWQSDWWQYTRQLQSGAAVTIWLTYIIYTYIYCLTVYIVLHVMNRQFMHLVTIYWHNQVLILVHNFWWKENTFSINFLFVKTCITKAHPYILVLFCNLGFQFCILFFYFFICIIFILTHCLCKSLSLFYRFADIPIWLLVIWDC